MFQFWFTFQLQFQLPAQDLWLLPQGPAGVLLPTWHLPTCEVEKKVAVFFGFWGYCLQCSMGLLHISVLVLAGGVHGVTAFDMGLLPLTWVYCL